MSSDPAWHDHRAFAKNGGTAFPVELDNPEALANYTGLRPLQYPGMTLRDFFAAAAIPGFSYTERFGGARADDSHREVARLCYVLADALLAEREKAK